MEPHIPFYSSEHCSSRPPSYQIAIGQARPSFSHPRGLHDVLLFRSNCGASILPSDDRMRLLKGVFIMSVTIVLMDSPPRAQLSDYDASTVEYTEIVVAWNQDGRGGSHRYTPIIYGASLTRPSTRINNLHGFIGVCRFC